MPAGVEVFLRKLLTATNEQKLTISRTLSFFIILFFSCVSGMTALNPTRRISQYGHTAWRIQDGVFNGSPIVITQTADGYLWIGTNIGLIRFDGVHFAPWSPPTGERLQDSRIFSLLGTRDGSLWIGTGYSVARWKEGNSSTTRN